MHHRSLITGSVLLLAGSALAQNVTIPATDGSLPAAGPNGCAPGYFPGSDQVIYTVPYTYQQVLSVIGNYTNLTWSGSPDNSVTTNNSAALASNDWTPGTARTYDIAGAHVIETITQYSKPANGPYVEVHTLAPLTIPSLNVSLYGDFDGQVWKPICNGGATWTNFTINFCASNVTTAAAALHMLHSTDAMTVGKFLGGQNFSSCAQVEGGNGTARPSPYSNGTISSTAAATATSSGAVSTATGAGAASSSGAASGTASGAASATASAPAQSTNAASVVSSGALGAICVVLLTVWGPGVY